MGIQAEIMRTALSDYLGTKGQWCVGAMARDCTGATTGPHSHDAVSHCGQGAIKAAALDVRHRWVDEGRLPEHVYAGALTDPVLLGVERVLDEQHPEILEAAKRSKLVVVKGDIIPIFNDGFAYSVTRTMDGYSSYEYTPGVGYTGIKAAFEKYLNECDEKDL